MADIEMCKGTDCPLKETCYRFTAKPNEFMQSYSTAVPYNKETNTCTEYWNTNEQKNEGNSSS
jgi:hypothetical protein